MVLNERKIKILEAIINDYILTAEPIGSRTIAKKYDLGISSATVRNEMSDLEEMGFIVQPHASAGRVPSDKGYRYFVDTMKKSRELTTDQTDFLQQMIMKNVNQIDFCMKEVAKYIAVLTNYTTIVTEPQFIETKVKHVQLVPLDEKSIVLMLVTENNSIKNIILEVTKVAGFEKLNALSVMLTNVLKGRTLFEIENTLTFELLEQFQDDKELLKLVLNAVLSMIKAEDTKRIYTSGVKNILAFPEFSNLEKASGIFQALEEKEMLITLLGNNSASEIQVIIGSENTVEQMKDCSIIRANYKLANQNIGAIGIIGPTRMNYVETVSLLNGIIKNINKAMGTFTGG